MAKKTIKQMAKDVIRTARETQLAIDKWRDNDQVDHLPVDKADEAEDDARRVFAEALFIDPNSGDLVKTAQAVLGVARRAERETRRELEDLYSRNNLKNGN